MHNAHCSCKIFCRFRSVNVSVKRGNAKRSSQTRVSCDMQLCRCAHSVPPCSKRISCSHLALLQFTPQPFNSTKSPFFGMAVCSSWIISLQQMTQVFSYFRSRCIHQRLLHCFRNVHFNFHFAITGVTTAKLDSPPYLEC